MYDIRNHVNFVFENSNVSYTYRQATNGRSGVELVIKVKRGQEQREYSPIYYLDLILQAYYIKIDSIDDLGDRIKEIYDAKAYIIHKINAIKDEIYRANAPVIEYDFASIINQLDAVIDLIRIELDNKKYNLEVEKLRKENKLFTVPMIIAALALIISLLPYIDKWFISDDSDKSESKRILLIQEAQTNKTISENEDASSLLDSSLNKADTGRDTSHAKQSNPAPRKR